MSIPKFRVQAYVEAANKRSGRKSMECIITEPEINECCVLGAICEAGRSDMIQYKELGRIRSCEPH